MAYVTIRAAVAYYFREWGRQLDLQETSSGFGTGELAIGPCNTIEWTIGVPLRRVELVIYDESTWLQILRLSGYLISETQYEHCDPAFPANIEDHITGLLPEPDKKLQVL